MIPSAVEYSAQQSPGFVEDLKTIRNVGLRHGEGPSDCDNAVVRSRSVLKSKKLAVFWLDKDVSSRLGYRCILLY
jgi:hypothetical protein